MKCQDAEQGKPGCLDVADPKYTMDFTSVENGAFIHWCSNCGPEAWLLTKVLNEALESDSSFAGRLNKQINKAYKKDPLF